MFVLMELRTIYISIKTSIFFMKPGPKKVWLGPNRHVFCHGVWCVCGHGALPLTPCAYCSRNSLSLDDIR